MYGLKNHICTKEQALKLLQAEIVCDSKRKISEDSSSAPPEQANDPANDDPIVLQETSNQEKPTRKSIFDDVLNYTNTACRLPDTTEEKTLLEEIEEYSKEPNLPGSSSELVYWRRHQTKYVKLSSLAKKYLSIPASSGGVERLFSVAGSIARARRNRLTPKTLETILMYREWRIRKSCT